MPEPVQEQVSSEPEVVLKTIENPVVNDTTVASNQANGVDPDAQAMLIGSLRSQIQDLFSQVTQLNNKLVQSYDRVSDLEDGLHAASSNARQSSVKISQLELERTQHLAALNTGLLVEKSHVTAELTRLMEKATEEAAQRGQAETARADIEKDLDDLSATLFDQANTMVAEARFARAQSERKVEDAERALKVAEEAVAMMQQQMQELQAEKEKSVNGADEMRALMGKGKWVEKAHETSSPLVRLRSSHSPYQEFLLFIAHLRSIRPSSISPPAISTLLPLPFLARLLNEDSCVFFFAVYTFYQNTFIENQLPD
jgi:septation ring formation regulator EzrA